MEGHQIDCIFLSMVSQSFYHGSITAYSIENSPHSVSPYFHVAMSSHKKNFPSRSGYKESENECFKDINVECFQKRGC